MMIIKECFIDTETTSADTNKAGLWQIGGIIRIDGVIKEKFELKCDIFDDDEINDEALKMHGLSVRDFSKFPDPLSTYQELVGILDNYVDRYDSKDKFFFMGYGAEFDAKILRRWFEGLGDKFFGARFYMPWICVMTLAGQRLMKVRHELPNFQLHTVAEYLKIKRDDEKFHSPLYDAETTMMIYDMIKG